MWRKWCQGRWWGRKCQESILPPRQQLYWKKVSSDYSGIQEVYLKKLKSSQGKPWLVNWDDSRWMLAFRTVRSHPASTGRPTSIVCLAGATGGNKHLFLYISEFWVLTVGGSFDHEGRADTEASHHSSNPHWLK